MSTTSDRYTFNNLSPSAIEKDLKEYLNYQDTLSDYNFEASGLNTLIKLLAYNTLYNNVYDSFALNESFLDSAVKRENIISHANLLNYVPRSYQSATAVLNIVIKESANDTTINTKKTLEIPAYTEFTAQINGNTFTFYTLCNYTMPQSSDGYYYFDNVTVKEGELHTLTQEYAGSSYEKFVLNYENVDTSTINVKVFSDSCSTSYTQYYKADNIMEIDADSTVYFLHGTNQNTYEIQFGSDVFGKGLSSGNVVQITFMTCNGSSANGSGNFAPVNTQGYAIYSVAVASISSGGMEYETNEEIKYNAPRYYTTQNRCVTANDFSYAIKSNFQNVKSVNAWGGEEMNPPEYGKVFISVIPKTGESLTVSEKNYIKNSILSKRMCLGTLVEFKDPDYVLIGLDINVYYDTNVGVSNDLISEVSDVVENYNETNLGDYSKILRFSKLSTEIDNADEAITNNSSTVYLYKIFEPIRNTLKSYTLDFHNPIYKSSARDENVISSGFFCSILPDVECFFDDDPVSECLNVFYYDSDGSKNYIMSNGTIDYENGIINIDEIKITSISGNEMSFKINPSSNDVVSSKNSFIKIDMTRVAISALPDNTNENYIQISNK